MIYNMEDFLKIFQNIGSVVGILITLTTFWGIISKKPKEALRRLIREETIAGTKDLKKQLNDVVEKIDSSDKTDLALLRNTITHIYFKYKDIKKIPHYEKENVLFLYEQYVKLKGNSYIISIVSEMKQWHEQL